MYMRASYYRVIDWLASCPLHLVFLCQTHLNTWLLRAERFSLGGEFVIISLYPKC